MKKILVINGHPDAESFDFALSQAYEAGAREAGAEVTVLNIGALNFNPNLQYGYRKRMELEPDLVSAIEDIHWADHLVWVFPVWWSGYPAIMKGFIDRTFLPGITYENVAGKPLPKKLLKGKTGHMIITSDTPAWYDYLYMKRPTINQFKKGVLQFCGVGPVKVTRFSVVKGSSSEQRAKWVKQVAEHGQKLR
ncbi:NAD(P)H-dependent oxidoreductase [Fulvivirga maritima]|uniref:NAD(P)H-dependent oxidoreductase n=1 Tax=Fulvivirga maritima TaxID=2904247 RepID=UPI001F44A07E|nr:NAD(P)H-dependent oxidoreductase [Fulvivirga maritima]UII28938.1 NAD(P)H-dependent oxidoreductase [Fulvivirga maritima]